MIPKFRAWLKEEKEMISVDSMEWYSGEFLGIGDRITFWKDADEIEIMQSTGLKDKNDVEIFEGDIVTASEYEFIGVGVVRYEDSLASFVVEFIDKELIEKPQFICQFRELEVIGNVHENKELLE